MNMYFRLLCLALFGTISAVAAEVPTVTAQNFDQSIQSGVVLVDFYGPWCGPCKKLGPVIDSAAEKLKAGQKIVKVNIDQSKDLARRYRVSAVPTLILFKNGKEVDRMQGFVSEEAILEFINSAK
jgi:thioredoxin 1